MLHGEIFLYNCKEGNCYYCSQRLCIVLKDNGKKIGDKVKEIILMLKVQPLKEEGLKHNRD